MWLLKMASKGKPHSHIHLIERETNKILCSKLASKKQAMLVVFYNMRCIKSLIESTRLVISETVNFWQKARIPVREPQSYIVKLKALYNEWRMFQNILKERVKLSSKKNKILKKY